MAPGRLRKIANFLKNTLTNTKNAVSWLNNNVLRPVTQIAAPIATQLGGPKGAAIAHGMQAVSGALDNINNPGSMIPHLSQLINMRNRNR